MSKEISESIKYGQMPLADEDKEVRKNIVLDSLRAIAFAPPASAWSLINMTQLSHLKSHIIAYYSADEGHSHIKCFLWSIHGHHMSRIEYNSKFKQSCRFDGPYHFSIEGPRREQLVSELFGLWEVDPIYPFHGPGGGDDQIILTIVDENGESFVKKIRDSIGFCRHEICIESVVDVVSLAIIDNIWVESIDGGWNISVSEIRL